MRVLMSGGGTAGHINPALAIAEIIKKNNPDAAFLFVGTPSGMESKLIPQAGFDYASMPVSGFQRKLTHENGRRKFEAARHRILTGPRARKSIRDCQPDIAIGTG